MITCKNCGAYSSDNAKFCLSCGYKFGDTEADINSKLPYQNYQKKKEMGSRKLHEKKKTGFLKKIVKLVLKIVILAVVIFCIWKFYYAEGVCGTYDLVSVTGISDKEFEYDISGYKNYYMIFNRDRTGVHILEMDGYGIAESFQWYLDGEKIVIQYENTNGTDEAEGEYYIEVVQEGWYLSIIDDEMDQKWLFKRRF